MTQSLATTYKNAHAATIRADMDAKREACVVEVIGTKPKDRAAARRWELARQRLLAKIGYPRHQNRVVMKRHVADGIDRDGQPKTRLRDVTLAKAALPVQAGVTVEIIETDFTGGRDENGQKVEDGHGAIVCIKTAAGCLKVHHGYHRGGNDDVWEDADA